MSLLHYYGKRLCAPSDKGTVGKAEVNNIKISN